MNWIQTPASELPPGHSSWCARDENVPFRSFSVVTVDGGWMPLVVDVARDREWFITATMQLAESATRSRSEAQGIAERWAASRWAEHTAFEGPVVEDAGVVYEPDMGNMPPARPKDGDAG